MDMFGLGILLNAKDNASASIYRVNTSLEGLVETLHTTGNVSETEMNRVTNALEGASNTLMQGLSLTTLGKEISGFGTSVLSPLVAMQQEAISTGSQFEQWRITLEALYKDSEVASQKTQEAMKLAAKTPFEVGDVMQALIGFKAIGAEALQVMDNVEGASDQTRTFLEYVGDLASLRPDVGLNGVLLGIRNLIGGDGGKSLRMRMDMDFEQIMGEDWADTPEEIMNQVAKVSNQIANGLMSKLEGTWEQMISNLNDQTTRLFKSIAENGNFDSAKRSLQYISDAIGEIDDDRMKNIGKNISSAFDLVWKPLDFVIRKLTDFGMAIVNLIETSPLFTKFIVGLVSLLGVFTIALGGLTAFAGGILLVKGAIALISPVLMSIKLKLISFASSLVAILPQIALVAGAIGVLSMAWKNDFGGVRTTLTGFMNNMKSAFSYSSEIASMGVNEMLDALGALNRDTWYGDLTYRLTQVKVFWTALCDAWNDYTLSDENFQKLQALGLLPLLETILDLKLRFDAFWEGFKLGIKDTVEVVVGMVEVMAEMFKPVIDVAVQLFDSIFKINSEANSEIDFSKWETFGRVVGILSGIFLVFKGVMIAWNIATGIATGLTSLLAGAVTLLTSPITLVILGIGALIAIGYILYKDWDNIMQKLSEWWQGFKDKVAEVIEGVGACLTTFKETVLAPIVDFISTIFLTGFTTAFEVIGGVVDGIVGGIVGVIQGLMQTLGGLIDFVVGVFTGDWGKAWQGVVNIFEGIMGALGSIVKAPLNAVINAINAVIRGLNSISFDVPDWVPLVGGNSIGFSISELPQLSTGGYIKDEGISMLHPNEVVVNDELTQKLRKFLNDEEKETTPSAFTPLVNTNSTNSNTRSVDTSTHTSSTDNSIKFEQGAIQITMTNGNADEVDKLVKQIAEKLKREMGLRNTLNYRPQVG